MAAQLTSASRQGRRSEQRRVHGHRQATLRAGCGHRCRTIPDPVVLGVQRIVRGGALSEEDSVVKRSIVLAAIAAASISHASADLRGGQITEHDLHIGNSTPGTVVSPAAHFLNASSEASSRPNLLGGIITEHDLQRRDRPHGRQDIAAHFRGTADTTGGAVLGGYLTVMDWRGDEPRARKASPAAMDAKPSRSEWM